MPISPASCGLSFWTVPERVSEMIGAQAAGVQTTPFSLNSDGLAFVPL